MKLRYIVLGGAALWAARYVSTRVSRIERKTEVEAIDRPDTARAYLRITSLPQFRVMNRILAGRAVSRMQEGRALDIGSGPGRLAIEMARLAPRLAVIGLDLSDPMIHLASSNAAQAGVGDRVTFIKGAADQVPYPDASFDLVVSTLSLHHWSDPIAVFDEVARILRPGGRFLIFDLRRDLGPAPWLILWFATHFVVPAPLRQANEPMGSREAAYTPREVVDLLCRSRLQDWKVSAGPFWLAVESTT